jgi:peptidoglycan hydrolase CwlO-like protein
MSTAGKVLSVLVMLVLVVWIVLASGVARLNTNGNKELHDLVEKVAKLREDVEKTQVDVVGLHDQAATIQEKVDHDLIVLTDRQTQLKKANSQIRESLDRYKYQVATVEESAKNAQDLLQHRNAERDAEQKALADARSDVKSLMADSDQLMNRLNSLRNTFKKTYEANIENLGKH